jgi:methylmalonyl-CoA mutase N-terminal domain/subunit
MWAQLTKSLGATDPAAQKLRFHTQTGGSTLTAQQPLNNVIRVTNQAMAAVLGGTQSLHTNGFDEALSLPTEAAAKVALRTQQIIAFESGVTDTVDPLAGSFFVESLTDEIEAAAWKYIEIIDAKGGSVAAIEEGYIQNEIANSAYQYQKDIESTEAILVGVNKYVDAEGLKPEVFRVDDSIRKVQIDKLISLRAERDGLAVDKALDALRVSVQNGLNTMPYILAAVEVYATLGEIADTFRKEFGEY